MKTIAEHHKLYNLASLSKKFGFYPTYLSNCKKKGYYAVIKEHELIIYDRSRRCVERRLSA